MSVMISFSVGCSAWPSPWHGNREQVLCREIQHSLWGSCSLRTAQTQICDPSSSSSQTGWHDGIQLGPCTLSICDGFSISKFPLKNNRGSGGVLWDLTQRKSASLHSDKAQKNREKQNCLYLTRWKREELKPQISCINYEALPAVPSQNPKIHKWNSKATFSKFLFFFLLSENPGDSNLNDCCMLNNISI